ncbi:MAG: LPS export ABC transporter ATP-binding protein [Opitutales bacterium]|nr:LPS export ABC transporter ATP-binding protein [Opitutales bacterium]
MTAQTENAPGPTATTPTVSRLETQNLVKSYKRKRVVNEVDIFVEEGEVIGLLGPNGAGKTTTFYMIVGLIPANEGQVFLDGEDITHLPIHQRARRGIGYLPQEPSVFRKLTVEQNIRAVAELVARNRKEREKIIEEHLEELNLSHLASQRAYTLSGGERRRLEISRALVLRPKFLFLDEPFSGVDPKSVEEVQKMIGTLRNRGIGIVITDHNVRATLKIVDRAYLLFEGKVQFEGTPEALRNDAQCKELYLGKNFDE